MVFSQEIINVLDYLGRKFGMAIDWTSENVMPYIEDLCSRYIRFEINTSIAWIICCVGVMVLAGIVWAISGIVHARTKGDVSEGILAMSMVCFWVALAVSVVVGMYQAYNIIECCTIPEKIILEYLETLVKSAGR